MSELFDKISSQLNQAEGGIFAVLSDDEGIKVVIHDVQLKDALSAAVASVYTILKSEDVSLESSLCGIVLASLVVFKNLGGALTKETIDHLTKLTQAQSEEADDLEEDDAEAR